MSKCTETSKATDDIDPGGMRPAVGGTHIRETIPDQFTAGSRMDSQPGHDTRQGKVTQSHIYESSWLSAIAQRLCGYCT
jgi:hypothetical protein